MLRAWVLCQRVSMYGVVADVRTIAECVFLYTPVDVYMRKHEVISVFLFEASLEKTTARIYA